MNDWETIREVFERDEWVCQWCSRDIREGNPQRAHILSQGKETRRKFGNDVIDSPMNMKSACSLYCNQKLALNWALHEAEAEKFAEEVREYNKTHKKKKYNF